MWALIIFLTITILVGIISNYYMYPKKDLIDISETPKMYIIEEINKIDIQNNYECEAFSSAYILRHFGIQADGNELYKDYPYKLFDGTIAPKGIIKFFIKLGFKVSFNKGNINTLKKQISKGIPVIVLIRVFPNKRYLHFVPVIGYDEEYLYFADSLKYTINCTGKYYNRKTKISDFEAIWRTWIPFYKNTYILVHQ